VKNSPSGRAANVVLIFSQHAVTTATKSRFFAALRMTCHPERRSPGGGWRIHGGVCHVCVSLTAYIAKSAMYAPPQAVPVKRQVRDKWRLVAWTIQPMELSGESIPTD
jgi:hypothetical protein